MSQQDESRNFWNTCYQNGCTPEACEKRVPQKDENGKIQNDPECPWWIDSPEHNYDFWNFVRDRSDESGNMDFLYHYQIADYFGCSATKIHFILKEALEKLRNQGQITDEFYDLYMEEAERDYVLHKNDAIEDDTDWTKESDE